MLRFLEIWYGEWGALLGFLLALVSTFVIFFDSIRQNISAGWWKVAAVLGTVLVFPSLVLRFSPEPGGGLESVFVALAIVGMVGAFIAILALVIYLAWGRRVELTHYSAYSTYGDEPPAMATPAYTPLAPAPYPPPPAPAPCPTPPMLAPRPSSAGMTQIMGLPPKEMGMLVVRSGPRTGQSFSLSQETNIGRDAQQNQISLDDPQMSRENSRIRLENGVFVIYDLASTNGTYVNGHKISRQVLRAGDDVRMGDISFTFVEIAAQKQATQYQVSLAHPRLLSKRYSSLFIVNIYLPPKRDDVNRLLFSNFPDKKYEERLFESQLEKDSSIKISLSSPSIEFTAPSSRKIENDLLTVRFIGKPKDSCRPGMNLVILSISDKENENEYLSETFSVKIVDFAFDHISRPFLSNLTSIILGICSATMFVLTLLDQIGNALGFTSGATAGLIASAIFARFVYQYQQPSVSQAP